MVVTVICFVQDKAAKTVEQVGGGVLWLLFCRLYFVLSGAFGKDMAKEELVRTKKQRLQNSWGEVMLSLGSLGAWKGMVHIVY